MAFSLVFLVFACGTSALAGATSSAAVLKWKARQLGGARKQYAAAKARLAELGDRIA